MSREQAGVTTAFAFVALAIIWRHGWVPRALRWLSAAPGNALSGVSDAANAATGGNPAPAPQPAVASPTPRQATNIPGVQSSIGVPV